MRPEEIVRSGPNQYICKEGILHDLANILKGFKAPVVVTGHKSFQAFKNFTALPSKVPVIQHSGYCSDAAFLHIAEQAGEADVIIGIGGGVILDTAKSVADKLNTEVITIPTVVGTCAASTPLSVVYDDNGSYVRVDYHKRSSYLTLIDPLFLLSSPVNYFKSGIDDTLAKWYEAEAIIRNNINNEGLSIMVEMALEHSSFIKDVLLKESIVALESMKESALSPSFTRVVETVITLAGTVGGYGGRFGRMAGAHAVHNGLSFIEETHSILHGQKVAYGILVQLLLENRADEVKGLIPFYKNLDFPTNFNELGIFENREQAMTTVASHAIKPEESLLLMGTYKEAHVIQAIKQLESLFVGI